MTALSALAAGALVALAAGRAAGRGPFPTGAALVLLLVAVLRALDEAVRAVEGARPLPVLLAGAGLAAGAALRRVPRVHEPLAVLAVVLAHVGLLVSYGRTRYDVPVDVHLVVDPPVPVLLLLVGLLAGGALAALHPGLVAAGLAAAGLVATLAAADLLAPVLVPAFAGGLATAVLVPELLERARRAATGPDVAAGALAGVALVLVLAALPALLEGPPQRIAGLQALSNEAYASLLEIGFERLPLVPGLDLLRPG